MRDERFLTARIDGPGREADPVRVPWWSFTKTALATAALTLVARGDLKLDERIGAHPYTLRQLLQHRAGVPNYGELPAYHEAVRRGDKPWSIEELFARVGAGRLDFESGQGWRYSNVGYFLVRRLIETATGETVGNALRHLVFDPLGLGSVRLVTSADELAQTAWGNRGRYDPAWVYHGLLAGTPGDAARFLHRLLAGDVLPADLLAQMTARHPVAETAPRPWETIGYGLGVMIGEMTDAGEAIGNSGAGPGSIAAVYHFPERDTPCTIAAFAQGDDHAMAECEVHRLASGSGP